MRAIQTKNFATTSSLVGTLFLICALTFYYSAVLKIDYRRTALLDLGGSDPGQYFAQATAMVKSGYPYLQISYDKLPGMHPFGYPVLMLPWLKILPEADSILAPFRTNQTIGLLLLLATFGFYAYLAMPVTGGFATLLLATLPGFFTFSRSAMSEISASTLIVLAFMFAYLGLKEERRWKIYFSAVFLGLSLNIRLQSLFFGPLLSAMALFPAKGTRLRWFLHCLALLIVFAVAASPILVLNSIQFHSPFKTGYHFWLHGFWEKHAFFSPQYIPGNAALLWKEFALQPHRFTATNIYGTGTCFVAAFILLICVGLFFIRINRFVTCAFLAGLSFLAATVSYYDGWADDRFYLPLLVLLVAVAVLPVTWAAENLFARKRLLVTLGIFVLFGAACLGYPSRSGYNTAKTDRFQAWDALHFTTRPPQSPQFIAQRRFLKMFGRQPGIVLSDIDPVYLKTLLPDPFVSAPLDGKRYEGWSEVLRYDELKVVAVVKRGLDQQLPVYALFVSRKEMDEKASRLPALPGYQWTIVDDSNAKAAVLQLTQARSG
jgi:hypothetical protein